MLPAPVEARAALPSGPPPGRRQVRARTGAEPCSSTSSGDWSPSWSCCSSRASTTFLLFFAAPERPGAGSRAARTARRHRSRATARRWATTSPLPVQYGNFIKGIFVGRDYPDDPALAQPPPSSSPTARPRVSATRRSRTSPSLDIIKQGCRSRRPLRVAAFIMWIVTGVLGGIIAALTRGPVARPGCSSASRWSASRLPDLLHRCCSCYVFVAIKWQLVPVPSYVPFTDNPADWAQAIFLPALTLAAGLRGRATCGSPARTCSRRCRRTTSAPRAEGRPERKVIGRHGLRAALTPIVTAAGLDLGGLLGGAIITETVFNFHGAGLAPPSGGDRLRPAASSSGSSSRPPSSSSSPTSSWTCCTASSTRASGSLTSGVKMVKKGGERREPQ